MICYPASTMYIYIRACATNEDLRRKRDEKMRGHKERAREKKGEKSRFYS